MNVLIVDDQPTGRRLRHAVLEAEDIQVFDAADGVGALAVLEHEHVDDRFIRKPTSAAELVAALHELVEATARHLVCAEPAGEKPQRRNAVLEDPKADFRRADDELIEQRVAARIAQLEAENRQLASFAAFASHELRAPLRAVHGYLRRLREAFPTALPEEAQRLVAAAASGAARMDRLVNALLEFCQIRDRPLHKQIINLEDIARSALADLQGEIESRGIEITVGRLPRAEGDSDLLKLVFLNLLSNALKFSRDTVSPRVEIGFDASDRSGACFVRDNGIGFDMRHAARIFEPFEHLHRQMDFEGAGLGLAIVRAIIERHGGRVWTDAGAGRGAAFYFALKFAPRRRAHRTMRSRG